jgi:CheY-like chemotaxis protein
VAKILVADDNSNIQKMVGLALKDQGIDVVSVGNGEAAVRKLSDLHFDLVLADVFMPVRNGYEVCEFVKKDERFSHIPVILLVGAFDPLDEHEAQRVGADGVLKKPFVPPDPLISMVKSHLARVAADVQATAAANLIPPEGAYSPASSAPASPLSPVPDFPVEPPAAISEPPQSVPLESVRPAVEEMPARSAPVSIDASHQPLAFGSLLDSPPMATVQEEESDDQSFMPARHPDLVEQRTWDTHGAQEEVEEETKESFSWRREVPDEILDAAVAEEPVEEESPAVAEVAPVPEESRVAEPAVATQPQEAADAPADEPPVWLEEETPATPPPESFNPENFPGLFVEEKPVHLGETVEPTEEPLIEPGLLPPPATGLWEEEVRKAAQLANVWEIESASNRLEPAPSEFPTLRVDSTIPASQPEPFQSAPVVPTAPAVSEDWENEFPKATEIPAPAGVEHSSTWTDDWPASLSEEAAALAPQAATPERAPSSAPAAVQDMDAIVAKVLAKMNPEVLQQVTREILKPVIEALLRDELNKKS